MQTNKRPYKLRRMTLPSRGAGSWLSSFIKRTANGKRYFVIPVPQRRTLIKFLWVAVAVVAVLMVTYQLYRYFGPHTYALGKAEKLVSTASDFLARDLKYDKAKQIYTYQHGTANGSENKQNSPGVVTATIPAQASKGLTITDPVYKIDLTMTPHIDVVDGKQDGNRIVYPFRDHKGQLIYTATGTGIKEDIILHQPTGDTYRATYQLKLPDGTEARKESDGSIGIYGNSVFMNNVTASSEADQALLQKAKAQAKKDRLLFSIPAPIIKEAHRETSRVKVWYDLDGSTLTVTAQGLAAASFPLTIDPSIYIVTAQQFMNGNNETNIDFDVADKLIRKAPTTGARFNSWNATTALAQSSWGGSTVLAGGYMYSLTATGALYWSQISTTNSTLVSPNPGTGACANWCTSASYNLPQALTNVSMVAYNGFLYVIGGLSGTTPQSTIYVAKIGANGEPQLWNPTWNASVDPTKSTWTYWYTNNVALSSARSGLTATAYNNRLYVMGGKTSTAPVNTVEIADLLPTGQVSSWSASTSLPYNLSNHAATVYNDRLYIVGGNTTVSGSPLSSVYYNRINSNGTLNTWTQTTSFTTGRMGNGGSFATVWGAYLYISGGCSAVNASGYCTTVQSDTQLASINADGSLDAWDYVGGVTDQRFGHSLLAWRNSLYQVGGCTAQNTTTGVCTTPTTSINYGVVNQDGDASTVGQTVASGTAPCSGGAPISCNLPGTASIGNMLTISFISNGYLYLIGGCTNNTCSTTKSNTAYVAITSTGQMTAPANCPSPRTIQGGIWCVDTTNVTPGGVAAASPVVFNRRIYVIGGLSGTANTNDLLRADINQSDGSLGPWTNQTLTGVGVNNVSYLYAFARANPSDAANNPGNLFILGGCATSSAAGCTAYSQNVYKCNIQAAGTIAGCTTTGQLQIGTIPGDTATGLGIMSGTVYANYIYLIGGVSPNLVDLKTVRYAKIDNNNNIVAVSGSSWIESPYQMAVGRRRSAAFGYNGYLYAVGGYEAVTGVLADIEFIKINVSNGSLVSGWSVSAVQINQRWGLTVPVSNSYAYVIGGCTVGASPGGCTTRTDVIQTFQVYNNDSGTPAGYSTTANAYTAAPNRLGASATILNGTLYVAGGCTGTSDCSNPTSDISYASLDPNGTVGTWQSATATLPAPRAWGKLLNAGGSLYYVGGQDTVGASQSTIYYATPAGSNITAWNTATNGLPAGRTQFGAAVWNNRLYVVGGNTGTYNQAVYTTAGSSTFTVPTGITSLAIKAWGAGGGGGAGSGSTGVGGNGGGGGFATGTVSVTPGSTLTVTVGNGGAKAAAASNGGNGGGFSAVQNGATYLVQAGGGAGGGGANGTSNGGAGGAGGGASGVAGSAGTGSATLGGPGGAGTAAAGGTAGTAGSSGTAGNTGALGQGGDAGGSGATCTTAVATRGGNGGAGAGGKGGTAATCVGGGGGGGGNYGGGGGGSAINSANRGSGGGGGGSSLATGTGTVLTAGSGINPGNSTDPILGLNADGGTGTTASATATAGTDGAVMISYGSFTDTASVYVSPELTAGGDITSAWSTSSTSLPVARSLPAVTAYANNLYVFGGYDGANYLSDVSYSQLDGASGNAGVWTYSTSLPKPLAGADAVSANGYIYLVGGRNTTLTCDPSTLVAPVSANTTIASGNNPTGVGEWSATNQRYSGSRYGAAAAYSEGKLYVLGGGCGGQTTYPAVPLQQTTLLSQPQVAKYSIMLDTDSDVFPNAWLLNGVDNSIGARWQLKYRSMANQATATKCATMSTWGQEKNFGNVSLGVPGAYTVYDGAGANISCGRYFYFNVTVDSSQAFGYPDDVSRGPTITDLTFQFTADPSKRLMHGRTFTGGLQMPDDTPYYAN